MAKPTVQARVDPHVAEQIENYAEANDMSKSEAVRRFLNDRLSEDETAGFAGNITRFDLLLAVAAIVTAEIASGPTAFVPVALLGVYWLALYSAHRYDIRESPV